MKSRLPIADWFVILGNGGLIFSLILLAFQISQSADLTAKQMRHESMMGLRDMYLHVAGENPADAMAKAVESPQNLTTKELLELDKLAKAHAYHVIRLSELERDGIDVGGRAVDRARVFAWDIIRNRWGVEWWKFNRSWIAVSAPRVAAEVDRVVNLDYGNVCAHLPTDDFCSIDRLDAAYLATMRATLGSASSQE